MGVRDGAWQRTYDSKTERENRLTWPVIEDFLGVSMQKRNDSPELFISLPTNFLHGDFTDEDAQHIRKAVERTIHREFRKVWDRHVDQLATRQADRLAERANR